MRLFLSVCIVIFYTSIAFAQGTIKGIITDAQTSETLIAATVRTNGTGTTSDFEGNYLIELAPGKHYIEFSYVGYKTHIEEITIESNNVQALDVALFASSKILETATITGSKYERSLSEAPVSINVIKPDLIQSANTTDVSQVLDKVPGVQLIDGNANIRGGSGFSYGAGSRVLLLIDELPAHQPDAGRPNWTDIPVENIAQIEVLKGASSVLYGSSALNGIIHVRTDYATSTPVTKASMVYTGYLSPADERKKWWDGIPSFTSYSLMHKRKIGKLDLVASGFYKNLNSFREEEYEERGRGTLNLRYRINDRTTVGLNSVFNKKESATAFLWKNAVGGTYQPFGNSISLTKNTRYYFDPYFSIFDKKGNRHKINARLYYIENDNNDNQSNASNNYTAEYQFLKDISGWNAHLTSGINFSHTFSEAELYGNSEFNQNNASVYSQLDKKVGDKLSLSLGLRYEYYEQLSPEVFLGQTIPNGKKSESKLIKRASATYELDSYTFLRASFGEGYRFPVIAEKFISTTFGGFQIYPNIDLESETGWTTEFGIKQGVGIGAWEGYLDFSVFWSQYQNMMEFSYIADDERFGFQSQNTSDTDIKGVEFNVIGRFNILNLPLNVLAGYTYIDPTYKDFENNPGLQETLSDSTNILKYRSRHNFKADLEAQIKKFRIGCSANYTSRVINIDEALNFGTIGSVTQIGTYREVNTGGALFMDARISYNTDHWKLSLLSNNFLNEEYTVRPGRMEPPRNFSIRLDFNI